jgi:hypothetical protein
MRSRGARSESRERVSWSHCSADDCCNVLPRVVYWKREFGISNSPWECDERLPARQARADTLWRKLTQRRVLRAKRDRFVESSFCGRGYANHLAPGVSGAPDKARFSVTDLHTWAWSSNPAGARYQLHVLVQSVNSLPLDVLRLQRQINILKSAKQSCCVPRHRCFAKLVQSCKHLARSCAEIANGGRVARIARGKDLFDFAPRFPALLCSSNRCCLDIRWLKWFSGQLVHLLRRCSCAAFRHAMQDAGNRSGV